MHNDLLLAALARRPVSRPPVWLLRQAGRYLPEYRALRRRAGSILSLFRSPELACEAALQPLARYPLDAAILFSDILTIPDAMGLGLYFADGEGPRFAHPLRSAREVKQLPQLEPEESLAYVLEAVRLTRIELAGRVPLIGFAGSPWTLAAYMVEGSGGSFEHPLRMCREQPAVLHQLLDKLTRVVAALLNAQAAAGAQVLQIFDTWGGLLEADEYAEFSLRYLRQLIAALEPGPKSSPVPVILFVRDGGRALESLAGTGCNAISLDSDTDLLRARRAVGDRVALQGNLDPALLCGPPAPARAAAAQLAAAGGALPGYIFNLGHGIPPQADPDTVAEVVRAVVELRS